MTAVLALPCLTVFYKQVLRQARPPRPLSTSLRVAGQTAQSGRNDNPPLSWANLGLLFSSSAFLAFLGILLASGHPSVLQPSNQQLKPSMVQSYTQPALLGKAIH